MSVCRQQAQLDVPLELVWALVSNPDRYAEWWPRFRDAQCPEELREGCEFPAVMAGPAGKLEDHRLVVDDFEDCRELNIRCVGTGTYTHWTLTESRGGTFIDAEFGMDPTTVPYRVFDVLAGKRYFRRWLKESLSALSSAAEGRVAARPESAID